jgi:hypothetical protein
MCYLYFTFSSQILTETWRKDKYHAVFFLFSDLKWPCDCCIGIGEIVDHHRFNFLFMTDIYHRWVVWEWYHALIVVPMPLILPSSSDRILIRQLTVKLYISPLDFKNSWSIICPYCTAGSIIPCIYILFKQFSPTFLQFNYHGTIGPRYKVPYKPKKQIS